MITTLDLERFQGFEIPQSIRLAPLTLVYGPNSGGKSSILRALRFIDQVANSKGGSAFNGPKISLGGFRPAVFSGDTDRTFKLEMSHDCRDWRETVQRRLSSRLFHDRRDRNQSLWSRSVDVSYEFDAGGEGYPLTIEVVHVFVVQDEDATLDWAALSASDLLEARLGFRRTDGDSEFGYQISHIEGSGVEKLARILLESRARRRNAFPGDDGVELDLDPESLSLGDGWRKLILEDLFLFEEGTIPTRNRQGRSFLGDQTIERAAANAFSSRYFSFLRSIGLVAETSHIGPLRTIASNFEYLSANQDLKPDGSNILSFLASLPQEHLETLSDWLKTMTEGRYGLQIISADIGEGDSGSDGFRLTGGDLTNLYLKDFHTKTHVSPANAGVGLSQILPVLGSLLVTFAPRPYGRRRSMTLNMSRKDRLLLIEQPELHLHPRMQAELAEVFINALFTLSKPQDESRAQLIVETHSEPLLMRLQKHMAKGALGPEDVSIIYVDQFPGGGNLAQELRMNADGSFRDSWPLSFSELRWAEMGD
jgi:predicted ATPase